MDETYNEVHGGQAQHRVRLVTRSRAAAKVKGNSLFHENSFFVVLDKTRKEDEEGRPDTLGLFIIALLTVVVGSVSSGLLKNVHVWGYV